VHATVFSACIIGLRRYKVIIITVIPRASDFSVK